MRKPFNTALTWLGGLALVALLVYVMVAAPWMSDEDRYALAYGTNTAHVHADEKPSDCDWTKAPMGSKSCHYEKHVEVPPAENGELPSVFVTWEKVQD
ncbi:MAG TPA: hypothetical protein VKB58_14320 [Terriglobales bacterium]|nr:hypothetical protein [Terriglobales bacterium]